jgi:glutamate synthase (NADPH/NADH) small chain
MQIDSRGLPLRPSSERIKDFDEAIIRLDEEWAVYEASRCIHCPDPAPCQKACPAGNDISYGVWLIENGQFIEAAGVYRQTCADASARRNGCARGRACAAKRAASRSRPARWRRSPPIMNAANKV